MKNYMTMGDDDTGFLAISTDRLNDQYTVGDLTVTNQPLAMPNLPSAQQQLDNLGNLADVLTDLTAKIGPFTIASAFRTAELQAALSAAGEPTSAGLSFHELGRGVDIIPTGQTLPDFFGKILASDMKNQFAEIAFKPSQGSIHLSINTSDDFRWPKILGLNDEMTYAKLTPDEIAKFADPFMDQVDTAVDFLAANPVEAGGFGLTAMALIAAGFYLFMGKSK